MIRELNNRPPQVVEKVVTVERGGRCEGGGCNLI